MGCRCADCPPPCVKSFILKYRRLSERFRIDDPKLFNLTDCDPAETAGFERGAAERIMLAHSERMTDLQQRLYAQHSWALIIILKGLIPQERTAPLSA